MTQTRLWTASENVKAAVILGVALHAAGQVADEASEQTGETWRALSKFVEDHLSSRFAEKPTGD